MSAKDETTMKNVQQLSLSLSEQQLEKFVTIIESLAELLQTSNKDTEKAYKMYLNSIQSSQEDAYMKTKIIPFYHSSTNATLIKH